MGRITLTTLLLFLNSASGCKDTVQEINEDAEEAAGLEDLVETAPLSDMYKPGVRTPIEVLYYEPLGDDSQGKYYLSELTMDTAREGTVTVIDIETSERVLQFHLDASEPGFRAIGTGGAHQGLSDFVASNYTEWCGRWHKGIRNYWKLCGGSDCEGEGNRWCIKKVDRNRCEQLGNCPTND